MTENKDPGTKTAANEQPETQEYVQTFGKSSNEDFGYYFYPNRNPGKIAEAGTKTGGFWGGARSNVKALRRNMKCKQMVETCANTNLRVKLMMRALRTHGCPVNLDRHIHCEPCKLKISGGFDFFTNQVVICQNNIRKVTACCNVLSHELLHAFDQCRTKFDPSNAEHIACTEIRAANLFHCSLSNSIINGEANPWNFKERHADCVRRKAITSLLLVRNISSEDASAVLDKVFDRCYNDLEPFGRRLRPWTRDIDQAMTEGLLYGYTEQ